MNRQRQNEIMRVDRERRNARKRAEAEQLGLTPIDENVDTYLWSRSITGEPSAKNRVYRASDNCWKRGLARTRTVGVATDDDMRPLTNHSSVKVFHPDGTEEIRSASEYRGKRTNIAGIKRKTATVNTTRNLIQSLPSIHT